MKGFKLLTLIVVPGLLSVANARAEGVTFGAEPYVGYAALGGLTANQSTVSTDAGKLSGVVLGARGHVGFLDMFFAGPDLSYNIMSYAAPSGTTYSAEDVSSVSSFKLGLMAGLQLPTIPFRFWLGYNFLDKL